MAVAYYTKKGYACSVPLTDNTRYDLIIDNGTTLQRVQCKTSNFKTKSGNYSVVLKTCGGNQSWTGITKYISSDEVDIVFIYTFDNRMWSIPSVVLHGRGSVTMYSGYAQYEVCFG